MPARTCPTCGAAVTGRFGVCPVCQGTVAAEAGTRVAARNGTTPSDPRRSAGPIYAPGHVPNTLPNATGETEPNEWHADGAAHCPGAWADRDDRDDWGDRAEEDAEQDHWVRVERDDGDRTTVEEADLTKLAEHPLHEPELERTDPEEPPLERGPRASAQGDIGTNGTAISGGAEGAAEEPAESTAPALAEAEAGALSARAFSGAGERGVHEAATPVRRRAPLGAALLRPLAPRSSVVVVGLILAVLALAAPALISSVTGGSAVATRPTAAPATPTLTPIPSPTIAVGAGLVAYVDSATGYEMGYPATWTATQQNPGVAFDDTDNNYEVHVILPDNSALPSQTDPTTMAANWVDYALDSEQQRWGASNFQRLGGPTPPVTIGGQAWQAGTALIGTPDGARIRLQVYATIHTGTAFVLVLLAPDELFAHGQQSYFGPMLASFEFLPATS